MKKTICLNMIVKDEAHVIARCLNSVIPFVDYWVIIDTGSTDGTQNIIKKLLSGIPGELYERPWVDFAYNRNEALNYANKKSDYILFIDADDRLIYESSFALPDLQGDIYCVKQQQLGKSNFYSQNYIQVLLIKNDSSFKWAGVLHEALVWDTPKSIFFIDGVINDYTNEGRRHLDPDRRKKDIQTLEKFYRENPENSRTVFYLATEYLQDKRFKRSDGFFPKKNSDEKCIGMGGSCRNLLFTASDRIFTKRIELSA